MLRRTAKNPPAASDGIGLTPNAIRTRLSKKKETLTPRELRRFEREKLWERQSLARRAWRASGMRAPGHLPSLHPRYIGRCVSRTLRAPFLEIGEADRHILLFPR